jgi:hypothetical protein
MLDNRFLEIAYSKWFGIEHEDFNQLRAEGLFSV